MGFYLSVRDNNTANNNINVIANHAVLFIVF